MPYVLPRRLALALALLAPAGASLSAPLAACPPQQRQGSQAALLDSASVFDGEPEKKVELLPDFANLEWDLAADQQDARARGETIHLVCKYKASNPPSPSSSRTRPRCAKRKASGTAQSCRAAQRPR